MHIFLNCYFKIFLSVSTILNSPISSLFQFKKYNTFLLLFSDSFKNRRALWTCSCMNKEWIVITHSLSSAWSILRERFLKIAYRPAYWWFGRTSSWVYQFVDYVGSQHSPNTKSYLLIIQPQHSLSVMTAEQTALQLINTKLKCTL